MAQPKNCCFLFLQIISLESWVTIMYYIQDAHSFWNWIYFVFLIVVSEPIKMKVENLGHSL
jgi:hypothetical protein